MRIAIGGFMHETNTFVETPTVWEDFARTGAWPGASYGDEITERFQGLNIGIAGFAEEAIKAGHLIVPVAWCCAQPGGRVTDEVFERMSRDLVAGYKAARAEAVYVELHGAMVSDSHDDAEGELLHRIRTALGPDMPIVSTLDLHANVSPQLVEAVDLLSSFRTYPHIDWGETGARAARWLDRVIAWKASGKAGKAFRRLPFLIPITSGCTMIEPMQSIYAALETIEAETGVHLSFNPGFPPADIEDCAATITAYGPDQATTDAAADRLMKLLLDAEGAIAAHRVLPEAEAVTKALARAKTASRPVMIADTQDNPGAGSPSNTTGMIAELMRQGATGALVGLVHDPATAARAHAAGVGATIDGPVGGGLGNRPGQTPLDGPWKVVAISDGKFAGTGPMLRSKEAQMGPTALIEKDGVRVVVNTIRQQPVHLEAFTHLGIDLMAVPVLVVKSSVHFRSGFHPIAEEILVAASPGENPADPADLPFTKLPKDRLLNPRAG